MGDKLKKKAKAGFDPRSAFGTPAATGNTSPITIGPKEQIIRLDPTVVGRGTGTIGETVGKPKPKSSFTRSTGGITAGRTRSRNR